MQEAFTSIHVHPVPPFVQAAVPGLSDHDRNQYGRVVPHTDIYFRYFRIAIKVASSRRAITNAMPVLKVRAVRSSTEENHQWLPCFI